MTTVLIRQQDMVSIEVAENGQVTMTQPSSDGGICGETIWFWPEHIDAMIDGLIDAKLQIQALKDAEASA